MINYPKALLTLKIPKFHGQQREIKGRIKLLGIAES
jgi:hypothetical protein